MAISVPSQFHISVCTSELWRLDWTGAIPLLINTPSSLDRRCCYNWFLPAAADFRPDPPFLRAGGSVDKKFSSCFLNSYIIQTHFRMKQEEPPPAPVARRQPDRSNMFPILSVPLTRNWEWIRSPSPPPPISLLSRHLRLAEEPTTQQGQISPSLTNMQVFQISARVRKYLG